MLPSDAVCRQLGRKRWHGCSKRRSSHGWKRALRLWKPVLQAHGTKKRGVGHRRGRKQGLPSPNTRRLLPAAATRGGVAAAANGAHDGEEPPFLATERTVAEQTCLHARPRANNGGRPLSVRRAPMKGRWVRGWETMAVVFQASALRWQTPLRKCRCRSALRTVTPALLKKRKRGVAVREQRRRQMLLRQQGHCRVRQN